MLRLMQSRSQAVEYAFETIRLQQRVLLARLHMGGDGTAMRKHQIPKHKAAQVRTWFRLVVTKL